MKLSLDEIRLLITALDNRITSLKDYGNMVPAIREAKELQSRLHDERRRIS